MPDVNAARRKRQYQAEAIEKKVRANNPTPRLTDLQLWREVIKVLDDTIYLRRVLGHSDKIADAVIARAAVDELRMRGEQLRLPI